MQPVALKGLLTVVALALSSSVAQAEPPQWRALTPPVPDHHGGVALNIDRQSNVIGDFQQGQPTDPNTAIRPPAGAWGAGFLRTSPSVVCCFDGANNAIFAAGSAPVTGGFRPAAAAAPSSTQDLGTGLYPSISVNDAGASITAFFGGAAASGPLKVFERAAGAGSSFVDVSASLPGSPTAGKAFGFVPYVATAIDADGSGVVVFYDNDDAGGRLQVMARANNGVWSGPTAIGEAAGVGPGLGGDVTMVSNAAGDTLLAWKDRTGDPIGVITGAFRPRDGAFGAPVPLGSGPQITGPVVAMASDGTAYVPVTFSMPGDKPCGPAGPTQPYKTELVRRDPTSGDWATLFTEEGKSGDVAVSRANGHVAFTWTGYFDLCGASGTDSAIRARTGNTAALGANTLLPGQSTLSELGEENDFPMGAIDDIGRVTVVWAGSREGGGSDMRSAGFDDGSEGTAPVPPPNPSPVGGGGSNPGSAQAAVDQLLGLSPPRFVKVSLGEGPAGGAPEIGVKLVCKKGSPCQVVLEGFVLGHYRGGGGGRSSASARGKLVKFKVRVKRVTTVIPAGATKSVKIKISRSAFGKIRTALRAGGKARLELGVKLDGRKGKTRTIRFRGVKKKTRKR